MKIVIPSIGEFLVDLIEYSFALLIILSTRSVYANARDIDLMIPELCFAFCIILFLVKIMQNGGLVILDNYRAKLMFEFLMLSIIYAIGGVSSKMLFAYFGRFFIGVPIMSLLFYIYAIEGDVFRLLRKLVNIMCLLSFISCFFWIFGSVLHVIEPTGVFYTSWATNQSQTSYYGIYFEQQKEHFFGYSGFRNDGIFVEAPMHALCLLICISICLFLLKYDVHSHEINLKRKLIILSVTMVTTFSSTGIILLIGSIIMYILINIPKESRSFLTYVVFFGSFLITLAVVAVIIFNTKNTNTVSWVSRLDGYRAGFYAFRDSPIFGTGFRDSSDVTERYLVLRTGFLNAVASVLAQGGILLSLMYWFPMIRGLGKSLIHKETNISCLAIIVIASFMLFTWEYTFLMLILLAFFLSYVPSNEGFQFENVETEV